MHNHQPSPLILNRVPSLRYSQLTSTEQHRSLRGWTDAAFTHPQPPQLGWRAHRQYQEHLLHPTAVPLYKMAAITQLAEENDWNTVPPLELGHFSWYASRDSTHRSLHTADWPNESTSSRAGGGTQWSAQQKWRDSPLLSSQALHHSRALRTCSEQAALGIPPSVGTNLCERGQPHNHLGMERYGCHMSSDVATIFPSARWWSHSMDMAWVETCTEQLRGHQHPPGHPTTYTRWLWRDTCCSLGC